MSNRDRVCVKIYSRIIKCAAKTCTNDSRNKPLLRFFPFPENATDAQIWTTNAQREDLAVNYLYKNKKYVLCSEHFETKYFNTEHTKFKKNIKPIPTIFYSYLDISNSKNIQNKDDRTIKTHFKANTQQISKIFSDNSKKSAISLMNYNNPNEKYKYCNTSTDVNIGESNVEFGRLKYTDNLKEELIQIPGVLNSKTNISDQLIRRNYCRLCAKQLPLANLVPIFNNDGCSTYADMLEMCFPGRYKKDDIYPHDICSACIIKLEECCKILNSFIEAENTIHKIFNTKETAALIFETLSKPSFIEEGEYISTNEDMIENNIDQTILKTNEDKTILKIERKTDYIIKIQCLICMKLFSTKNEISDHINRYHLETEKNNFRIVNVKLKKKSIKSRHISKEKSRNKPDMLLKYQCLQCKQLYVYKDNIIEHVRKNHPEVDTNKSFYKIVNTKKLIKKPPKPNIRYECLLCNSQHPSQDSIHKHIGLFHKNVKDETNFYQISNPKKYRNFNVTCLRCSESFTSNVKYHEHMKKHTSFKCKECGLIFDKIARLNRHMEIHNQINVYICHDCNQQFNIKEDLIKHVGIHRKPKENISCSECDKKFTTAISYRDHVQVHDSTLCSICKKVFPSKRCLKKHILIHTERQSMVCDVCNKVYKTKETLTKHKQSHNPNNEHVCQFCGKQCKTSAILKQHVTIHSDTKKYVCNICGSQFHRKGNRDKHIKIHNHKPGEGFKCKVCDKELNNYTRYRMHIKEHKIGDKKQFSCKVCNKKFSTNVARQIHLRVHSGERPFSCAHCEKTFRSKPILQQHLQIHQDIFPHECSFCDRKFRRLQSLIIHQKTHTDEQQFPCPTCRKAFASESDMSEHQKIHDKREEIVEDLSFIDENLYNFDYENFDYENFDLEDDFTANKILKSILDTKI